MTDLNPSTHAPDGVFVTLPLVATTPAATALPGERGQDWRDVSAKYRAARAALDKATDDMVAVDASYPRFPDPIPESPRSAIDDISRDDLVNMRLRDIITRDVRQDVAFDAAKAKWFADREVWDRLHTGATTKCWSDSHDNLTAAFQAVAGCRVINAADLTEKIEIGLAFFHQDGPGDRYDDTFTAFFEAIRDDARALAATAT